MTSKTSITSLSKDKKSWNKISLLYERGQAATSPQSSCHFPTIKLPVPHNQEENQEIKVIGKSRGNLCFYLIISPVQRI